MVRNARYGTRDLAQARVFYDALAGILGASRLFDMDNLTAYRGPQGGMFVIGLPYAGEASVGNGTQVVFDAPSRAGGDAPPGQTREHGGKLEGPPGFGGPQDKGV
jgi:hypothetical protein